MATARRTAVAVALSVGEELDPLLEPEPDGPGAVGGLAVVLEGTGGAGPPGGGEDVPGAGEAGLPALVEGEGVLGAGGAGLLAVGEGEGAGPEGEATLMASFCPILQWPLTPHM